MKYKQESRKLEKIIEKTNELEETVVKLQEKKITIPGGLNFINKFESYDTGWIECPSKMFTYTQTWSPPIHPPTNFTRGSYGSWNLIITLDGQVDLQLNPFGYGSYPGMSAYIYMKIPEELCNYVNIRMYSKSNAEGMKIFRDKISKLISGELSPYGEVFFPSYSSPYSSYNTPAWGWYPLLINPDDNSYLAKMSYRGLMIKETEYGELVNNDVQLFPTWVKCIISINPPYKYGEKKKTETIPLFS